MLSWRENIRHVLKLHERPDMRVCPNCGGEIAIRNPTGNCDHLYWPDYLTPEAKIKVAEAETRENDARPETFTNSNGEFDEMPF